jgi:hypothetical protein
MSALRQKRTFGDDQRVRPFKPKFVSRLSFDFNSYLSMQRQLLSRDTQIQGLYTVFPRKAFFGVIAATLGLMLAGCGKSYTYKYRVTVSVRDHGELKKAFSVVAVTERAGPTGNKARPVVCGEATALRLNSGKFLFALLNGVNRDAVPGQFQWTSVPTLVLLHRLGLETEFGWKDDTGILRLPETRTPINHLHVYEMPDLVTFRDISDPATVERVDPEHPEQTLGKGIQLENVSLEATGDRVTRGAVNHALPWFSTSNQFLDGSPKGESVRAYQTMQFKTCSWIYLSNWF